MKDYGYYFSTDSLAILEILPRGWAMYFCPCCGYRTFDESPPGSYLVCPICFWEDTGEIDELRQAQLNFLNYGACDRKWLEQVHEPREQEEHNSHWQLLDEQIKAAGANLRLVAK